MEKRRKNRIILSHRYSDTRFRRKKTGSSQLCIKHLTYGTPYDILYTGGEKQMSNRNRKHPEKKKSDIDLKSWLLGAITDLTIGIILLILDKLLN